MTRLPVSRSSRIETETWLPVEVKPHMRYPLRGQDREEMREMVKGVYRGYVKAELKIQIEGLNSLYNMTTWLEAPHFETLKKTEGAAAAANSKGGRKQLWWAMLCNGMFQLFTSQGDVQARVTLLAHKAVVEYERLPKNHGFSMTLPDKRTWSFAPLAKQEAGNWIFAFEYWRLRHAHSHHQALALLCAPTPKHSHHGHHGAQGHHAHHGKRLSAAEHRRRSMSGLGSMARGGGGAAAAAAAQGGGDQQQREPRASLGALGGDIAGGGLLPGLGN